MNMYIKIGTTTFFVDINIRCVYASKCQLLLLISTEEESFYHFKKYSHSISDKSYKIESLIKSNIIRDEFDIYPKKKTIQNQRVALR